MLLKHHYKKQGLSQVTSTRKSESSTRKKKEVGNGRRRPKGFKASEITFMLNLLKKLKRCSKNENK